MSALRRAILLAPALGALVAAGAAHGAVLRVGTYNSIAGQYSTIQAAVDAAQPGDTILIAPGDYKERNDYAHPNAEPAGVLVTTPDLTIRGMDRNGVVIDGTKPGSPECSSAASDQDFGPDNHGRNGLVVLKADGVTVENLTACNFLGEGNEIWWNGGDGSGRVGMRSYTGKYLSATTTYYDPSKPTASYGIFASNARGPGLWDHTYASNMDDSDYYVGACPNCNMTITDAHAQNSALGYSGTNSGGHLVIENSEWDHNQSGIVTNSQNNDDAPSPQDGSCPGKRETGPTGTHSCWIIRNNNIHDNNNPNVPQAGSAAAGPTGTGVVIAGGRHDIVSHNRIAHNGAWGVLLVPYPDIGNPPPVANCAGGIEAPLPDGETVCYFDDWANEVADNTMIDNGFFGNPTNGDFADVSNPHFNGNCFHGNHDTSGPVTSEPPLIQATHGVCGIPNLGDPLTSPLGLEVGCDTQFFQGTPLQPLPQCLPGDNYPRPTHVKLRPLPSEPSMPDPCQGVPTNPWCP
jgi:hypothetical protein